MVTRIAECSNTKYLSTRTITNFQQKTKKIGTDVSDLFSNWINDNDKKCTDGKDDGSISSLEATESTFKGLFGFVKAIVNEPVMVAVSTAAIVGLTKLTKGAFLPLLTISGLSLGTLSIGKGIVNASNAKTDKEAKESFEEIGGGIFGVAISALTAKAALSEAVEGGVQVKGITNSATEEAAKAGSNTAKAIKGHFINSTKETFVAIGKSVKAIPECIKHTWKNSRTGFSNSLKAIKAHTAFLKSNSGNTTSITDFCKNAWQLIKFAFSSLDDVIVVFQSIGKVLMGEKNAVTATENLNSLKEITKIKSFSNTHNLKFLFTSKYGMTEEEILFSLKGAGRGLTKEGIIPSVVVINGEEYCINPSKRYSFTNSTK